jgi:hypothetical protein
MTADDRFKQVKQIIQEQKEEKKQEEKIKESSNQSRRTRRDPLFNEDYYLFKGKLWGMSFARRCWQYNVYNKNKNLLFIVAQKMFKLREEIRFYTDAQLKNEILKITAQDIIDIWNTYEVYDSCTNEIIGFLKCRGILRGHWVILSSDKTELARLKEKTGTMLVGYFLGRWLPRKYNIKTNQEQNIAVVKQKFNPFVARYILEIKRDDVVDPRLLVVLGALLVAVTFQRKG